MTSGEFLQQRLDTLDGISKAIPDASGTYQRRLQAALSRWRVKLWNKLLRAHI
jgi:hypothetical protein